MFCSACGAESASGLQFCKRCGANLSPSESVASIRKARGLVWIVAFGIAMLMGLPLGGIAVVFERLPGLLELGFPLWFLMVLAIFCLAMVSLSMVIMSRLLTPVFKTYLQTNEAKPTASPELSEPAAAIGAGPREALVSITEGTTRVLENGSGRAEQ